MSEGLEAGDEVSRAVFESAVTEVDVPDKQWRLGDYEILDEIGRGGMGVIYLARQRHPNRIVAVKRVLDHHAGLHQTVKRFRREADAAASLDHPNILPIYEVSESEDGLPFFSMKYATGGSLQKVGPALRGKPRECVQLMAKVSRAVEYAHGQGILHRDLKPGNILLDGRGEPMVSDFGLAKFLDANKDLTKSLTTFGTPGYTAPEQAGGAAANLTPAADVYSLGTILFELLAGRPPFVGDNALAVIRQAAETPAPKLRSLSHSHNRDLETICARCLERDPKARYQTAGDLATDLERWLDGRSIIARPISVPTRLGRWSRRNPKLIATGAACLLFGAATMWFFRGEFARMLPAAPEKSIAILPFENLSRDPDNAYFADGIQEEILTRLAGIADLKVISRTSTQRYQSKPRNLREIAKQLGVANILEGSVQKLADQARVNVQLINAQTDSHLWADTYDRKVTDILGVESEIAKGIAEALQAKLTGREEQVSAVKPTNNPEAYDAYLRGLAFHARSFYSDDALRKAIGFFEQAVQLDPDFALAWARLSRAQAWKYYHIDPMAFRRDIAKNALDNAQKLDPNSAETLLALAYYQRHVLGDLGAAKTTFERVSEILPGSSEVPMALGRIARDEGHWDESNSYFDRALSLDPRNVDLLSLTALNYTMLRQFPAALKFYDRALDIVPKDPDLIAAKAGIYQAQGNLKDAAMLLSELNAQTSSWMPFQAKMAQLRLERNYDEAIHSLQTRLAQYQFLSTVEKSSDQSMLAVFQRLAEDSAGASLTAKQARAMLEEVFKSQPTPSGSASSSFNSLWADLSVVNAVIGEKDSALKAAERAIMLCPSTKDPLGGPNREEILALVQAIVGENSSAISTLARLLRTPYFYSYFYGTPVTPALLRLDPIWDPLRADPAFQKLCLEKIDKSIAVLPFENLSSDPDNAYFADGIQEEILTRLASIADLKVISRTSTQRYQSKPRDLGEIAKQLGVANILEGSVQKAGDQVRVNVQLINAQTDSHLWADSYDRKLTDIFGVQTEIAKGIAAVLQAKISTPEQQALALKPTNNPEAYDAYLRGLAFEGRGFNSNDLMSKAAGFYERTVELDPNFAVAWARLCRADAFLYFNRDNDATLAARGEAARRALENAQKLDPASPETLLALGYYQYWGQRDYGSAKVTFDRLRKLLPGSSETPYALALVARREGHWDQSVVYYKQAVALDPRHVDLLMSAAQTYTILRQFPEALKLHDRAMDILPNDPYMMASKASIYLLQGNLKEAASLLSGINEQTPTGNTFRIKITQLRVQRDYGEAVRLLQARQAQFHFDSYYDQAIDQVVLASMQRLAGDTADAKVTAEQARNSLEPLYKDQPGNHGLAALLSQVYAVMEEKDLALKEAERATMLLPRAYDAAIGPQYEENLARIQTMFGENSRAISTLHQLLQTPYTCDDVPMPITLALLRLDPIWDPLRADPAFQKLCEEKQPLATP